MFFCQDYSAQMILISLPVKFGIKFIWICLTWWGFCCCFLFFNSDGVAFKGFEISKKFFIPFQMDFFVAVQSHHIGVPIVLLAGLEKQS